MTIPNAAYAVAKAARAKLEAELTAASRQLNAIPGVGSGPMGLTPDAVKFAPEYRQARAAYEAARATLNELNRFINRTFAKEIRAERRARRTA